MRRRQRGQTLVLFALMVSLVLIPAIGLAIDASYAYAQRRQAQNASDLASLAGARQIALALSGMTLHECDVRTAIDRVLAQNGAALISPSSYGTAAGPQYVSGSGTVAGPVHYDAACTSAIPTASGAMGVEVGASRVWRPFFLGIIGISNWTASAQSTSRTGYLAGPPSGGQVFPVGLACANFVGSLPCNSQPGTAGTLTICPPTMTASQCGPVQLTDETNNMPGGKGWLEFGAGQKCNGSGLGQDPNFKCSPSQGELQSEIGHPGGVSDLTPGDSHGCCTAVGLAGSADKIGSLTGLKGKSLTCDWYIAQSPPRVVLVPIWDSYTGQGQSSGSYHIVGFAGFEVTSCANGFAGVWRTAIFGGPTSQTPTPGVMDIYAVQLVK